MSDSRQFAIVTGASTGIGLELASCCAQSNFDLLIAADEPQIETAAASLRGLGAAVEADGSVDHRGRRRALRCIKTDRAAGRRVAR
ncbi:short-subunit dehydrogenase [Bradyrhizobium sp. URHC0002]